MKCNTLAWETAAPGGAEDGQRVSAFVGRGAGSRGRLEESGAVDPGHGPGTGPRPGHALAGTAAQRPTHPCRVLPAAQSPRPSGGAVAGSRPPPSAARSLGARLCHPTTAARLVAGADRGAPETIAADSSGQSRGDLSMGVCRGARLDPLFAAAPPTPEAARLFPAAHQAPYSVESADHRATCGGQWPTAAGRLGGGHVATTGARGGAATGGRSQEPVCRVELVALQNRHGHAGRPHPGAGPAAPTGAPDDHVRQWQRERPTPAGQHGAGHSVVLLHALHESGARHGGEHGGLGAALLPQRDGLCYTAAHRGEGGAALAQSSAQTSPSLSNPCGGLSLRCCTSRLNPASSVFRFSD